MVYTKFVEVGRVAYVAFGPDEGKLVTIVDCIDQNKALVDGPCSGVARKAISFKQLHLTNFKLDLSHGARTKVVKKFWEKENINAKWEETTWAKKIVARKLRTQLSDFDRFKLMKAKQARNRIINVEFGKLRKAHKKEKNSTAKKGKKAKK